MTRLQPLDPPYDPEVARTLGRMVPPGMEPLALFRAIAHNRHLLERLRSTGAYLLAHGTLDPLEREIAIHRTCARCGCSYEWGVHAALFAPAVGLSPEQLRSTWHGGADDDCWSERQALVVRLCDALHDAATVSDELWRQAARTWTAEQLVELVALAGQYHGVSFFANAFGVEAEPYAAPVPPA